MNAALWDEFTGPARITAQAHIGPGNAIRSMREFEKLRHMKDVDLRPEQVTAMRAIRDTIGGVNQGDHVAKVIPLSGEFGATNMVQNGNPNMAGFFTRASDLNGAQTTQHLVDRLRLDHPGQAFPSGAPHAIIETRANAALAANAREPRTGSFNGGSPLDDPNLPDFNYPFTGNGFTASRDGHLVPEFRTAGGNPVIMSAGADGFGQPVTTMRFRFSDGAPYPQTIHFDGVPITASDWRLMPHPTLPGQFRWEPI